MIRISCLALGSCPSYTPKQSNNWQFLTLNHSNLDYKCTFKLMKNSKCSLTVSLSKSTLCCGQSPRLSRIASISVSMLLPSTCAEPEVGGNRPVKMDIVVVFPAPLWPSNAVIWPLYMFSVSPSTATLEPVEPWRERYAKELLVLNMHSVPDCWVRGRGSKPQTGPTLRVLK